MAVYLTFGCHPSARTRPNARKHFPTEFQLFGILRIDHFPSSRYYDRQGQVSRFSDTGRLSNDYLYRAQGEQFDPKCRGSSREKLVGRRPGSFGTHPESPAKNASMALTSPAAYCVTRAGRRRLGDARHLSLNRSAIID